MNPTLAHSFTSLPCPGQGTEFRHSVTKAISLVQPIITNRAELIALVQRLFDLQYTEEEFPSLMDLLSRSTGSPKMSDLMMWPERPMTASEMVDAALEHRPIILGDTIPPLAEQIAAPALGRSIVPRP